MKTLGFSMLQKWYAGFDRGYFFNVTFPLSLAVVISFATVWAAIWVVSYGIIPGWVASPMVIAIWCYQSITFWRYEQWRASGPRGVFVNPGHSDRMLVVAIWLLCGMFLFVWNVYLRNRRKK